MNLKKMELYYYFLSANVLFFLFLFCKCPDNYDRLDVRFVNDWNIGIRKEIKKCNKYIGSKANNLDKVLVTNLIDSISRENMISIKSLQISNWRAKQEINYHHGKSPKHEIYYDFILNEKYFYRIILDKISLEFIIKKLPENKIYYISDRDVYDGDTIIEFSYVKYLFKNKEKELQNVYVFCKE